MKKTLITSAAFIIVAALLPLPAGALCVKNERANLRAKPGTQYEKTWEVYMYMPLKRLEKRGEWYKVQDVDGDVHWVYGSLVTSKFKCAVVKEEYANIRSGPGTTYKKILYSPAPRYSSFRVLKTQGDWIKVLDDYDNTGWIHRRLLWIQ